MDFTLEFGAARQTLRGDQSLNGIEFTVFTHTRFPHITTQFYRTLQMITSAYITDISQPHTYMVHKKTDPGERYTTNKS